MHRFVARLSVPLALAALAASVFVSPALGAWVQVGNAPVSSSGASTPSLTVLNGVPQVVASTSTSLKAFGYPAGQLFDNGTWTPLGGTFGTNPNGRVRSAVIGGQLWAVSVENTGTRNEIRVHEFFSGTWQDIGAGLNVDPPGAPERAVDTPSIAAVGTVPYVAWSENDGTNNEIRVKRFVGGSWQEVGPGASINVSPTANALAPDIIGVNGVPYVAWQEDAAAINVKRFDGTAWQAVGAPIVGPGGVTQAPSLAVIGGDPYVAFASSNVYARRWDGSAWQAVGGGVDPAPSSFGFQASLADVDGKPVIAYVTQRPGGHFIILASRFESGAWTQLGPGPLSRNPSSDESSNPSVASVNGVPMVVFNEQVGGPMTIQASAYGEPPVNLTRPTSTGRPAVGDPNGIQCGGSSWSGAPTSFIYQWDRAPRGTTSPTDTQWTPINGAVGARFFPSNDDAGSRVRCRVTAIGADHSTREALATNSLRVDVDVPVNTQAPQVLGGPSSARIYTCDAGVWDNGPDFSYQWYADDKPLAGETNATYNGEGRFGAFRPDDNNMACEVTGRNDVGASAPVRSPNVHMVLRTPEETFAPQVLLSGYQGREIGRKVSCTSGSWAYDYGQYRYQWFREGEAIAGATSADYFSTAADLGRLISCGVVSTNPLGDSALARSGQIVFPLPPGNGKAEIMKAGGRNDFDPINLLALSKDFRDTVESLSVERLTRAKNADVEKCKNQAGVPSSLPVVTTGNDPIRFTTLCAIYRYAPDKVTITSKGVFYYGAVYQPKSTDKPVPCTNLIIANGMPNICPDLGYRLDPVDPTTVAALPLDLQAKVDPLTPVSVLWDYDQDGRTDAECPPDAPVSRTMLNVGRWKARATIVTKSSAETGIFPSAVIEFDHQKGGGAKLRDGQPFACRTSLDPPPDPEQGPCITSGTVGSVQLQGNLCPIYIRALDPKVLEDLRTKQPDLYAMLKTVAEKVALHRRTERPGSSAPLFGSGNLLRAGAFAAADPGAQQTAAALYNTQSSIKSLSGAPDLASQYANGLVSSVQKQVGDKFDASTANFSLDQIYWGQGPLKVNGVTEFPLNGKPTLLVPSEARAAVDKGKTMVLNTPEAQLAMGCAKNASWSTCALPLAEKTGIASSLDDAGKNAAGIIGDKLGWTDALVKKAKEIAGPFDLAGDIKVKLEKDQTATITTSATVPLIRNSDGSKIPLVLTLRGDRSGNVTFKGLHLGPLNAKLYGLTIDGVNVDYDGNELALKGKFLFPPINQGIDVVEFRMTKEPKLKALILGYLAGTGQGIPIGAVPGTYITKLQGGFRSGKFGSFSDNTMSFNAGVGISVGPSAGGGCPALGLDSTLDVTFGGQPEFVLDANADVILACIKLGNVHLRVDSRPYVHIDGQAEANLDPLFITGHFFGDIDPNRGAWQVGGDATIGARDLPIVGTISEGGKFALSNRGVAGCVELEFPWPIPDFSGGLGIKFPGGIPPLTLAALIPNLDPFFGCDLSYYKPLGRRIVASGAQAGASKFTLGKDARAGLLSIEGAGGAPHVKLVSPSGKTYDLTNATTTAKFPGLQGQIVEKEDRTVVIYGGAETGTWTAVPADGSPAIARIRTAKILPKAKVTAKASGVKSSRTLSYDVATLAGQEVRFYETATGGRKLLKVVKGGGRGTIRYTTGEASSTKRSVVAEIYQDDMPRGTITVARYTAPNPTLAPPRVSLKRSGSRLTLSWRKVPLAVRYEVAFRNASTGAASLILPKKGATTAAVPRIGSKDKVTIKVTAISAGGRKATAAKTSAPPTPRKKKK